MIEVGGLRDVWVVWFPTFFFPLGMADGRWWMDGEGCHQQRLKIKVEDPWQNLELRSRGLLNPPIQLQLIQSINREEFELLKPSKLDPKKDRCHLKGEAPLSRSHQTCSALEPHLRWMIHEQGSWS